ncbi:MAG: hypothetical protein QXJ97_13140, partial [Desulfurococcaceae archaeon]
MAQLARRSKSRGGSGRRDGRRRGGSVLKPGILVSSQGKPHQVTITNFLQSIHSGTSTAFNSVFSV